MISTRTAAASLSRAAIAFAATAAFVSAAVAPAAAASDPKAPKAQETPKPASKEKLYCVVGSMTGTILPRKTCKTRDQWIAQEGFDPLEAKREK